MGGWGTQVSGAKVRQKEEGKATGVGTKERVGKGGGRGVGSGVGGAKEETLARGTGSAVCTGERRGDGSYHL